MIISHKHRFIFIKTKRTAGTSVELALSGICGDKDIITPVGPKDEEIRKQMGIHGPQNYLVPFGAYNTFDWIKLIFGKRKRFRAHMSAKRIKDIVGDSIWNNYFKFCFVRNPWDRVVSLYYLHNKETPRITISEYIDSGIPFSNKVNNMRLYMIGGEIAVDKICYFENINDELDAISGQLGFPGKLQLPVDCSRPRIDKRSYREILSVKDRETISKNCFDEIRMFDYSY